MSRPARAHPGKTTTRVIEAIRQFEAEQADWEVPQLATRVGISPSHARNILLALTYRGVLQYSMRTVRKKCLALTELAPAASPETSQAA